ncbi:MAG: globin domain-containing protein [Bacteroidia bacterium]
MLSANEITLVKNTWNLITPVSQQMGEQFYIHLFDEHPELKPLFKSSPKDQGMKLMFMLSYLVHRLDKENELRDEIKKLAMRHNNYKAKTEHYEMIGATLIWSLKNNLGNKWTKEIETAWKNAYKFISDLMIEGQKN